MKRSPLRRGGPLARSSGLLRRTPLRSVGVRRRREGPVRRAAEAALFAERPYCWFDRESGVEVHGHELLSRSQGGDPTRPDALLCNWHNTWVEDNPIPAAWLGWKVSRKHPPMPCIASGEHRPWDHSAVAVACCVHALADRIYGLKARLLAEQPLYRLVGGAL